MTELPHRGVETGPDGLARCWWCLGSPEYVAYHDEVWGRPMHGERELFEMLTLELFQSGLSWLTILRKRESFGRAFEAWDIERIAEFGSADFERLMADAGIVRNRAKIDAAIANARAALGVGDLCALIWSHAPDPQSRPAPRTLADVPALTPESTALAKALKHHGFRFVGPTTAYALMQACGLVDDHLAGCWTRRAVTPAGG